MMFTSMHAAIRHVTAEVEPLQAAFFRSAFGALIFLPTIFRNGFGFLRTERLGMHILRAFLNAVSMFLFFTGLAVTQLSKVTALSFTSPLFMAVLSVIILGERMRIRRWTATLLGFVGMLVIVRPGFIELDAGSIMIIASSAIWAVTMIVIKMLLRTETSLSVTGYASIFVSLFALGPAIYVWQNPSFDAWMWMVYIGVVGASAQFLLAEALREADAGAIMPFDFAKLVWASLFGFYLFGEIPDAYTWVGASIIFASGLYIAYRENQVARQARQAAKENAER
ncbi:MAG: DMT family transporter [Alphaproteobacteria bacterium]|nr:DMT family transporter [Alphaproteobacteria bacterium]